jgi:hypothetical protein
MERPVFDIKGSERIVSHNRYIAIPLPKELERNWWNLRYDNFPDIRLDILIKYMRKKPHITLDFRRKISLQQIYKMDEFIYYNLNWLRGATVQINGLAIIGNKRTAALVGIINCSEEITEFQKRLSYEFPNPTFKFLPHLNIEEVPNQALLLNAKRVIDQVGNYSSSKAQIEGLYADHKITQIS